jgi:hypothetical protein
MDLKNIPGQDHIKRAIQVAVAGNHSLLIVDSMEPETFGELLVRAAWDLGNPRAFLTTAANERRFPKLVQDFDIVVDACRVPAKDHPRPRLTNANIARLAEKVFDTPRVTWDPACKQFDEYLDRLGYDTSKSEPVRKVAETIARLDGSPVVLSRHYSESLTYWGATRMYAKPKPEWTCPVCSCDERVQVGGEWICREKMDIVAALVFGDQWNDEPITRAELVAAVERHHIEKGNR